MSIRWFDRETLNQVIADHIQKVDVVLDIGCGIRPQTFFEPQLHICCEPHPEYVQILQNRFAGFSNIVILQGTAQEVVGVMPDRSVDSVFLIDVIEHLEKDDGHQLLLECERIARRQIILFTPLGFMQQDYETGDIDGWGLRGGEWQVHKSGWTSDDFELSWDILASQAFHSISGKGASYDSPFGAFWAFKSIIQKESITSRVKIAVLSHVLPPSPSGQAIALYQLLRNWNSEDYCLLSRQNYDAYACVQGSPSRLPARYYNLTSEFRLKGSRRLRVLSVADSLLKILQRTRSVADIVKSEKCGAIVSCSGDLIDLPAGYLAIRWTRVPFYAYIFDDYIHQWATRVYRVFAQYTESIMLKDAAGVIVPNEFLRDEYRRRYQVEPTIIRNSCEVSDIKVENKIVWPAREDEIKVVYTGAIYHAHYDAFCNLIAAMQQLGRLNVNLHLYTGQSMTDLKQHAICGPVVHHPHMALAHVVEVQRQADILFLPLAFNSPIPEVIKTSSPGKMGEYLSSGRPILVHAPADSFVSWYFKKHECGVVVDVNEPTMLVQAIQHIIEDAGLRQRLGESARARAATDFSLEMVQTEFLKLFQSNARG